MIEYKILHRVKDSIARVGGWRDSGAWVYEAYEVKKNGQNYAVFYFAGKRFFFKIYEVCVSPEKENAPLFTTFLGRGLSSRRTSIARFLSRRDALARNGGHVSHD